ncbi:MAG: hypothetical protein KIT62_00375 [Cyclobacteriaceae bacterium]|nr:hypothetical protein [Cyclobacteriaceae bacterium]
MNSNLKITAFLCFIMLSHVTLANPKTAIDTLHTATHAADTIGPVISASIVYKHIHLKNYRSASTISKATVFPKSSELTVAGTDASGIQEIYVSHDNATEMPYKEPIRLTARGRHTARIRAVDTLGNETVYSFDYIISE